MTSKTDPSELFVRRGDGAAVAVKEGGRIAFVQPETPGQVVDVNVFNLETGESLWSSRTGHVYGMHISVGDKLLSTPPHERAMMVITRDSLAIRNLERPAHDTLFGRCSQKLRLRRYGKEGDTPGCQEIIASAIAPFDLAEADVHDALNLFMQTWIDENDQFAFCASQAEAGDVVELEATMDCLVALSACPGASSHPRATGILVYS